MDIDKAGTQHPTLKALPLRIEVGPGVRREGWPRCLSNPWWYGDMVVSAGGMCSTRFFSQHPTFALISLEVQLVF